ncbi:hypothetical protein [Actinospongicola halichondriae]|uniref:hypothetical protein n=1 Tax=Actinospongicola halichondriae TaxID=3236844 RepID=UPI003D4789F6
MDLITQAEAVGDYVTAMRLKSQLHHDNQNRTGSDGIMSLPDEAETRGDSLRRQLEQALANGDALGASVFAQALADPGVLGEGNSGPAASLSTADQGSRTPPPAVPPLEQALAQAERDGDWDEHSRLNLIKLAQYAKDHPHG